MAKAALWWLGVGLLIIVVVFIWNMAADTTQTVQKEYAPSALLKKYEEFKDLSSAIDKKRADIAVYRAELSSMDSNKNMDKDDKFYFEQRKSELFGIISVHNTLCSQYNAQMSKFNYRFTNKGDLPQSNLEPLPREYKPYILSLKQ